jgi:hypothetical protein
MVVDWAKDVAVTDRKIIRKKITERRRVIFERPLAESGVEQDLQD